MTPRWWPLTIAQTLGLHERSADAPGEQLKLNLQQRALLLLLDNFEQVAAAAPLVAESAGELPQVKLLVTSRIAVHVRGEQEYPLLPLALPDLATLPPCGGAGASALGGALAATRAGSAALLRADGGQRGRSRGDLSPARWDTTGPGTGGTSPQAVFAPGALGAPGAAAALAHRRRT